LRSSGSTSWKCRAGLLFCRCCPEAAASIGASDVDHDIRRNAIRSNLCPSIGLGRGQSIRPILGHNRRTSPSQGDRANPPTHHGTDLGFRILAPKQRRVKGGVMFPPVPTTRPCPNCNSGMTVTMITPLSFFDGLHEATYKCADCSVGASVFESFPEPQSVRQ
jgi:hypothetical protein